MGDRRMASGGPGRVARGLLEAVFSNDFERAREYCSEDLVMTIEGIQTVRGHDALRSLMDFVSEAARAPPRSGPRAATGAAPGRSLRSTGLRISPWGRGRTPSRSVRSSPFATDW